ncbi:MAG: type III pantothenate kinase [Betaproteobacteria bacterium HGW-Betaproteobacteria-22]|nr:MAG: type III pantothenate kinase [Betaproteobacteria bacterium HGW-Betaproteobacteria-22]
MLLTIDAGNTRTKWAVFNAEGEITAQQACLNQALDGADFSVPLATCRQVIISNVAGDTHTGRLEKKLSVTRAPIHWLKSSAQAAHVMNDYLIPESLGSDRWAALIASWHLYRAPCLVVNAGTAVTIDALIQHSATDKTYGRFIGGMILPGLDLMQKSLELATAQLPKASLTRTTNQPGNEIIFSKSTADAIYDGALIAIISSMEKLAQALAKTCGTPPIIVIGGGNAALIAENFSRYAANMVAKQTVIVDNLVLKGLFLLAQPG